MANAKIDKMAAKSAKTLMMAATHTPSMSSPQNASPIYGALPPPCIPLYLWYLVDWNADWG